MFGKNKAPYGKILFDQAAPAIMRATEKPVFLEFRGAIANVDDDSMKVEYTPRDLISVNLSRISGFYDHTILVEGRKIRVMDTYAQIALKILEAMK